MDNDDLFSFEEEPLNHNKGKAYYRIMDCKDFLLEQKNKGIFYDAIVTDPPYELNLMSYKWDGTGIAFDKELWKLAYDVLKPGGFLLAFGASRLYHRLATAIEDAGFKIYPMLTWNFSTGLQKPVNVSELFDRDNVPDRKAIGTRTGSGFTSANVKHGAQNRSTKEFAVYERGVSEEAKEWLGYYYGVNCMKPCMEPICLAQKPIETKRAIDNIRKYRTGALNLGVLKDQRGSWPDTSFECKKTSVAEHGSDHPSVKPIALMKELCQLSCPSGGHILDIFGGTGTTALGAVESGFDCTIVENNPQMEEVIRRRLRLDQNPSSVQSGHSDECDPPLP